MIRTEEIRKIPQFSGQTTGVTQSDLQLRGGYWVYSSSFGGNLVDGFTVKDFLDNSNNEKIATDFFNYLQSNYSKPEFNEIYYDNVKLANVFNDYYDKTVVRNTAPTTTVANLQLTATTAVTYTSTNFINYNKRSAQKITVVVGFNTGDSYYVSVPLTSSFNILDNPNYDKYRKNSLGNYQEYIYAEWFRYSKRKGELVQTPNVNEVKENSFDDFTFLPPIPTNPPQLRIQFKNNKYVIPNNSQINIIPIEIVFDKPAPFQGESFQITLGSDLTGVLDPPSWLSFDESSNKLNKVFAIIPGQSAITTNFVIINKELLQARDLKIQVKLFQVGNPLLLSYVVSDQAFEIQTIKPEQVQLQNDISYDYVKESIKTRPQYLLQSFVDLNFNDSESEFYRNASSMSASLIPGLIIAVPPVPPIPPAPTSHDPNVNPVDITLNSLYNKLIRFGYVLERRMGIGGTVITMNGDNPDVDSKFFRLFGIQKQLRPIEFKIAGYNSITFDVNDVGETNRITGVLESFFSPIPFF